MFFYYLSYITLKFHENQFIYYNLYVCVYISIEIILLKIASFWTQCKRHKLRVDIDIKNNLNLPSKNIWFICIVKSLSNIGFDRTKCFMMIFSTRVCVLSNNKQFYMLSKQTGPSLQPTKYYIQLAFSTKLFRLNWCWWVSIIYI